MRIEYKRKKKKKKEIRLPISSTYYFITTYDLRLIFESFDFYKDKGRLCNKRV